MKMSWMAVALILLVVLVLGATGMPHETLGTQREKALRIAKSAESLEVTSEMPCVAGPFGGYGGKAFNESKLGTNYYIRTVYVWENPYSREVTGIRIRYSSGYGTYLGVNHGDGVKSNYIPLSSSYPLTKIEGVVKHYPWEKYHRDYTYIVSALKFTNSRGIEYGWYGNPNRGTAFKAEGGQLKYIAGRAGSRIEQLYFYFDKCRVKFGAK